MKATIHGEQAVRDVSTRYLGNYLGWHPAVMMGTAGEALLDRASAYSRRCDPSKR
jgi:hypothetical protein